MKMLWALFSFTGKKFAHLSVDCICKKDTSGARLRRIFHPTKYADFKKVRELLLRKKCAKR
ncbi:hypothetical protein NEPTK9_000823 [Candidatus Neptunochlamydia vexilliferae]|uniref:Uncharacterized protein n=1 Tax=Candidatus Neptunichlamydia vexilliferae TaxID=1651774 RepID=A0ABS0AYW2_9BACT|nr:hypothetical protein [Candidatus Neptunochlamydia vexilliferae]